MALNTLFNGVTNEEFKNISSMEVAKEAWTILETTYEGTKAVKTVKFQRFTSSFEEIRTEEDETFDEFYAKLKDIVNSAFNLGESIAESKIVRKILTSLPKRFHAKITAIEEVKDIDQILSERSLGPYLKNSWVIISCLIYHSAMHDIDMILMFVCFNNVYS